MHGKWVKVKSGKLMFIGETNMGHILITHPTKLGLGYQTPLNIDYKEDYFNYLQIKFAQFWIC